MGTVGSIIADRFDGNGPVIETPIENLAVLVVCEAPANFEPPNYEPSWTRPSMIPSRVSLAGVTTLVTVVWMVIKWSGVSLEDKDGDGVPDMT